MALDRCNFATYTVTSHVLTFQEKTRHVLIPFFSTCGCCNAYRFPFENEVAKKNRLKRQTTVWLEESRRQASVGTPWADRRRLDCRPKRFMSAITLPIASVGADYLPFARLTCPEGCHAGIYVGCRPSRSR